MRYHNTSSAASCIDLCVLGRRPLRGLLRIRKGVDGIKLGPHPERERSEQSKDALFSSKIDQGSPEAAMDGTAAATAVRSENTPVLLEERTEGVLRLVMNRPAQRNALSVALMSALQEALERAAADQACRVIIIAGAGPAFCAGHDLRELRSEDDVSEARRETYRRIFAQCSALMLQIVHLPKPVIAEVHGIATAAGCQLVATCDLAVAAADARFATPGVNIGLFCSTPMVALSRAIGRKRAMEMLLTGEMIDARTALEWGLVNRVVPPPELDEAVGQLAQAIVTQPFTFALPGFETTELNPWQEAGEEWRRLRVVWPGYVATHSTEQTLYVGGDGLFRRHDYDVEISGGTTAAHYISDYTQVAGIMVPTKHRILPRGSDGQALGEPLVVSIDLT